MINQSVHTLDLLYFLCGPIKALRATVGQVLDYGIEVEDSVTASLDFANGAHGLFVATVANYKNESVQISVQMEKERYLQACSSAMEKMKDLENVKKITLEMFKFQTTDESIVAFRRLLLIEKFRDPEIAGIYKNFFIDIPIQYQIKIFKKLQKNGLMIQGNAQVFAMEFYYPFYLYHFVEFEPEKLFPLLKKHVEYFLEGHMVHK